MDYIPLDLEQRLPSLRPAAQVPQAPHPGVSPETHQSTHPNSGPMGLARDHPNAAPSPLTMRPEHPEMALQEPDPISLTPAPLWRNMNDRAASAPPLFNTNPFNGSATTDSNPVPDTTQLPIQARTAVPAAGHLRAGATSASGTPGAALPNQPAQPTSSMPPSMPQDARPPSPAMEAFSDKIRILQQLITGAYSGDDDEDDSYDALGTGTGVGTASVTVNNYSNPANAGDWQGNGHAYAVSALTSIARSTAAHPAGIGAAVYPSTDPRQGSYHNLRRGAIAPPPDFPQLLPPPPLIAAQFAEPVQPVTVPVAQPPPEPVYPVHPVPIAVATAQPMPVARPVPRVITMVDGRLQKVIRPPPGYENLPPVTEPLEPVFPLQSPQQMMMLLGVPSSQLAFEFEPDGSEVEHMDTSQPEPEPEWEALPEWEAVPELEADGSDQQSVDGSGQQGAATDSEYWFVGW